MPMSNLVSLDKMGSQIGVPRAFPENKAWTHLSGALVTGMVARSRTCRMRSRYSSEKHSIQAPAAAQENHRSNGKGIPPLEDVDGLGRDLAGYPQEGGAERVPVLADAGWKGKGGLVADGYRFRGNHQLPVDHESDLSRKSHEDNTRVPGSWLRLRGCSGRPGEASAWEEGRGGLTCCTPRRSDRELRLT